MARGNQISLPSPVGAMRSAWRWWIEGLLPERTRQLFFRGPASLVTTVTDKIIVISACHGEDENEIFRFERDGLDAAVRSSAVQGIRERFGAHASVSVRVPASEVLRPVVALPFAAAGNLKQILDHEVERQCPIDPNQIYFDFSIRQRDKAQNRLDAELRLIKRERVDNAISLCRAMGLEPVAIRIGADTLEFGAAGLPFARRAMVWATLNRWSIPALSVAVAVLAVAVITAAVARADIAENALRDQLTEARNAARVIERLEGDVIQAGKRNGFLSAEKQKPAAIMILAELTTVLPENTFISELQMTGHDVRVHGLSSAASALIEKVDGSRLFANAQFRAPLVQDPQSGLERFDLAFTLRASP